jgi:hypothetical protein
MSGRRIVFTKEIIGMANRSMKWSGAPLRTFRVTGGRLRCLHCFLCLIALGHFTSIRGQNPQDSYVRSPVDCTTPPSDTSLQAVQIFFTNPPSDGKAMAFSNGRALVDGISSDRLDWSDKQATLVTKRVLSKNARLQVSAYFNLPPVFYSIAHVVPANGPISVSMLVDFAINGNSIQQIQVGPVIAVPQGVTASMPPACIEVPTSFLKFPAVATTGKPTPEANVVISRVQFRIDRTVWQPNIPSLNDWVKNYGAELNMTFVNLNITNINMRDAISFIAEASHLEYEAMAPVILVHGMNADANWFSAYKFSPDSSHNQQYAGHGFQDAFATYPAPYRAIDFKDKRIVPGGATVATLIRAAADSFGAHYVHIVGHSAGGLWSRAAVANNLSDLGVGVYSLTTVDSPHLGTYNADVREAVHANIDDPRVSLTAQQWLLNKTVSHP